MLTRKIVITVCILTLFGLSGLDLLERQAIAAKQAKRRVVARKVTLKTPDAAALSKWLNKPAKRAMQKRNFALAISLWQGIVAVRGVSDESVWQLAKAWQLAGQFDEAANELERYRDAVTDVIQKNKADEEIARLRQRVSGFSATSTFQPKPAGREASGAFRRGRRFFKKKQYARAILLFRAGFALAPDMPGNLRELGESYDKLGRSKDAAQFFVRYLRLRPFGKNADKVRKRLIKAGEVANLSVTSSFPCEVAMLNRQVVPKKLPINKLIVSPGYYKALCYSRKYRFAQYLDVRVDKGGSNQIQFNWAILQNKLQPWGRIVLENPDPKRRGEMYDVGLYDEIGVPVPSDRRALKVRLQSGDGTKKKEAFVKLEPGKYVPIVWD